MAVRAVTCMRSRSGRHNSSVSSTIRSNSAWRTVAAIEPHQGTQVAHDFSGALNLRHRLLRGLGDCHDIDRCLAHRIVYQPRISAGRHQRLIELMRHRGRELAHAAEPGKTRMRFLLQAQLSSRYADVQ